jgi:hypothetical protein
MRKLGIILGLVILPQLASAESPVGPNPPQGQLSAPPSCSEEGCLILKEKESIELSEIGEVRLEKVLEDSRCPLDAVCIWAGRVKVKISVKTSEACGKNYVEVGLGTGVLPTWTDEDSGLSISLEQVWPEKLLQSAGDNPYQLKLRVKKTSLSK